MPRHSHQLQLADLDWRLIQAALIDRGVPDALCRELRRKLLGRFDGLLLYGSWARGDADTDSDLDILVLNFRGIRIRSAMTEQVSIAQYSMPELEDVSGTLFGFHLVRDGVVLFDPGYQLSRILSCILPPAPGAVLGRVRSMTSVLDVSAADRQKYPEGLTRVARYLLRSVLYAEALDRGEPCFSVREIAAREHDPSLVAVLSSHASVRPPASEEVLDDLRARLTDVLGPLEPNPHGDLHELIEVTWETNRELSNFATLAISDGSEELPYEELPKVTL